MTLASDPASGDLALVALRPARNALWLGVGAALAVAAEDRVTVCDLPNIPPDSGLCRVDPLRGWMMSRHEGESCPLLWVPDSARDLASVIPRRMARKLRMNRHRAESAGGWT